MSGLYSCNTTTTTTTAMMTTTTTTLVVTSFLLFHLLRVVWRITGKIIRNALCCVVYDSCAQLLSARVPESQKLKMVGYPAWHRIL